MCLKAIKPPYFLFVVLFSLLWWGCQSGKQREEKSEGEGDYVSSVPVLHAKGFQIDHAREYTKVTIHNPWTKDRNPYAVYYLYKTETIALPSDGIKVKIPVTSLAVNTFSYFEFLTLLGEEDVIKAVTDGFRVYNPIILQKMETGEIIDLGDPFNPNVEKTMALKPQAIINSAYAQRDSYSERLIQAGFPVIYSLEWMENSPLARAEWIKLMAGPVQNSNIAF